MLIDVELYPKLHPVLTIVSGDEEIPKRILQGVYQAKHWSFDMCFPSDGWKQYPELPEENPYGVCDSIAQFFRHPLGQFLVKEEARKFVVNFTHIAKVPGQRGWRWHKWGPYIGEGPEPQCEYLADEKGFAEGVFTYHVYEAPRS